MAETPTPTSTKVKPWIAMTPNRRYALLVPQIGLQGWWQQLGAAGGFADLREAIAYARRKGYAAEWADSRDSKPVRTDKKPQRRQPDRTASGPAQNRWKSVERINGYHLTPMRQRALETLRALADDHGVVVITSAQLGEAISTNQSTASSAVRALHAMGLIEASPSAYRSQPRAIRVGAAAAKPAAPVRKLNL